MIARLIAAAALWSAACCVGHATDFTFAALGDAPYNAHEERRLRAMIEELNHEPLAFVVHVGDFKDGHSDCSDEVYQQRRDLLDTSRHALIFVPGDNEWTDCWRSSAGGYLPVERLQRLRELLYAEASSLGTRRLPLERQSAADPAGAYPEHARWVHEDVLFMTLNVPGGDNNFSRDRAEFRARDSAVRAWLRQSFSRARDERLRAVVVIMHANPWAAAGPRRHGFTPLLSALESETLGFPGEVVLIHGDTHRFRFDRRPLQSLSGRPLANFTRIEVFGSPTVNWVRVRVTDEQGRLRIEAKPGRTQ